MRASIDVCGIRLGLEIKNYNPAYKEDNDRGYYDYWCDVSVSLDSTKGNWLSYRIENQRILLCGEVDHIIEWTQKAIAGEFKGNDHKELEFIEPDLVFDFFYKGFYLSVFFWDDDGALTTNHLKLELWEEMEPFLDYLLLATGKISEDDERIRKHIEKGMIIL